MKGAGDALTSHKVGKGDIVYVELDSWIMNPDGSKKLFDTTSEELAKKEKIFEEKKIYGEAPVFLGRERLPKGLEESIIGKSVGEEHEVEVPPEKGAGPRDPKLIELHTIREFLKKDIEPQLGMTVVLGGRRGQISAITAGRVRVDFNNPLAGKTLLYKYKVIKKAENLEDKIRGLLEMDYGLSDQFKIKVDDGEAEIVIPDLCKTDERWFVVKFRLVADLRTLEELKNIRFVEEYEKKEEKPAEEKPEEKMEEKPEKEESSKDTKKEPEEVSPEEKAPEEL